LSELYLIAHKVRGEPAFDIAWQLDGIDDDGDPIWIIPTSGHRAYPYWHYLLDRVFNVMFLVDKPTTTMPDIHDHYPDSPSPTRPKLDISALLSPAPMKIERRF
jgi:hypothetical protein